MWVQPIQIHDVKTIMTKSVRKRREQQADTVSSSSTYCNHPLPFSFDQSESAAGPDCKRISSWHAHLQRAAICRLPSLPGGYICYNTNIIEATNEFLKSTIRGETTLATDITLALASLPASYTSNIPSCCFASIKFSIKSDISSKSSPWGGNPDKN